MRQIIEAIVTIAIITKLSISKTVTISEMKMINHDIICVLANGNNINVLSKITYNFKHCDFVQLQGFFGLTPDASNETCADELESRRSP